MRVRPALRFFLHHPYRSPVLAAALAGISSGFVADGSGPMLPGAAARSSVCRTAMCAVPPGTHAVSIELHC